MGRQAWLRSGLSMQRFFCIIILEHMLDWDWARSEYSFAESEYAIQELAGGVCTIFVLAAG